MIVIRAEHAGFCWGVTRVVRLAHDAAHTPHTRVYTYGPLIHNPSVIAELAEKGVTEIAPDACHTVSSEDTVIIRAHGIPPEEEKSLCAHGCQIIDGTCPHVVQIEKIVARAHAEGHHVVILGDNGHAEVDALIGYAEGDATVLSTHDAPVTLPQGRPITVVAQSTLDAHSFERWNHILSQHTADVHIHNTRCDATEQRQNAALALCEIVDMMIVIGGHTSANTRRLAEICRTQGVRTHHIERADELQTLSYDGVTRIGVTAGASTPEKIITEIVETLEAIPSAL